jgi:nucleoside-diphosphate-sugar epimerase
MKVAIVGASGFIGLRLVEQWILGGKHDPVAVVRAPSSLAVLARFRVRHAIASPLDSPALASAFRGCDAVVHAAIGDAAQIARMGRAVAAACGDAGVRRLVVLSSASVHGQNPAPGTDEQSPLDPSQKFEYNVGKLRAEREVARAARSTGLEAVLLRPSVVYGPRSRWIADIATRWAAGNACVVGDGSGVCNGIYVDNLVHAIECGLEADIGAGSAEAFLLNDQEPMSWAELTLAIGRHLGYPEDRLHTLDPSDIPPPPSAGPSRLVRAGASLVRPLLPWRLKVLAKGVLKGLRMNAASPDSWTRAVAPAPSLSREEFELQLCQWRYSSAKAAQVLGFSPAVRKSEALRASCAWLDFANWPPGR